MITDMVPVIVVSSMWFVYTIPPVLFILLLLLLKEFVKLKDKVVASKEDKRKLFVKRMLLFLSRGLIVALLLLALARPFISIEKEVRADPKLIVLMDNSTSMGIFDERVIPKLMDEVKQQIPVETHIIASDNTSDIGDGVLTYLSRDTNYLIVSDGRVNAGSSLNDVALLASALNSTLSVYNLEPANYDAGISISGPGKTTEDADNQYIIHVNRVLVGEYDLVVSVDDEVVLSGKYDQDTVKFSRKFSQGMHKIRAEVKIGDYTRANNVFYKTVYVVEKPVVFLLTTKSTPLKEALEQFCVVETGSALPKDLKKYLAVVIEDMPVRSLDSYTNQLQDYLIDGNGMLVIGGFNSYDNGAYANSRFSSLLPVKIGTGKKIEGDSNLIVLIDMSPSVDNPYDVDGVAYDRVEKAVAADMLSHGVKADTNVAVYSFDQFPHEVTPLSPLGKKRADVLDKIKTLQNVGYATIFYGALSTAGKVLEDQPGSKDIVLITDGHDNPASVPEVKGLFATLRSKGIKVHVVDVCRDQGIGTATSCDHDYTRSIAYNTNAKYFNIDSYQKLTILFSKSDENDPTTARGNRPLVILDDYHFITRDLDLNVTLYGFNDVVPKGNGNLLVAMDTGRPILTVWNYGLGRVASLTGFTQGNNLGPLLENPNDALFVRTVNWAVGNPERNKDFYIDAADTYIDGEGTVYVKSREFPVSQDLVFFKTAEQDVYKAEFVPQQTGFQEVYGRTYAVNYASEFQALDQDKNLYAAAEMTGGKVFTYNQAQEIVEFVKTNSVRIKTVKFDLAPYLLLAALLLYLTEVCIRRIANNLRK